MIYKVISWKNKYVVADNPIMKSYIFFDCIELCRHFKGFQDGGFRVELITSKSWFIFSFKKGFTFMRDIFNEKDFKIRVRFNKPIITFGYIDIIRDFKNVEVVA